MSTELNTPHDNTPPPSAHATPPPAGSMVSVLRASGVVCLLGAVLFSRSIVMLFRSEPLDTQTAASIISSQKIMLLSCVGFIALAECVRWVRRLRFIGLPLRHPLAGRFTLAVVTFLLPLGIAELCFRPFTVVHIPKKKTATFIQDKTLGWKLRPRSADLCRQVVYKVNAKGLRGPEIPYARQDPAAKRILYLGDSVTVGFNLEIEQAYPSVVQTILGKQGITVETINTGVDGYSPWQYDLFLRSEGIRYRPDLVVIGFVLNDITEKLSLVEFGGFGKGVQLGMSYYSASDWLRHNSGLYVKLDRLRTRLRGGQDTQTHAVFRDKLNVQDLINRAGSRRVNHAWDLTFKEMDRILEFSRAEKLPAAIVIFPYVFQFDAPEKSSGPQADIVGYAASRNVPCLDLLPLLVEKMKQQGISANAYFSDNVHPSPAGSEVIARLIADFLMAIPPLNGALIDSGKTSTTSSPP